MASSGSSVASPPTKNSAHERRRTPYETDPLQLCETVDSAALALCEAVARRVDHSTALVLRDEFSGAMHVVRVSLGGDRRLEGTSALPESAAARAIDLGALHVQATYRRAHAFRAYRDHVHVLGEFLADTVQVSQQETVGQTQGGARLHGAENVRVELGLGSI